MAGALISDLLPVVFENEGLKRHCLINIELCL